MPRPMSHPGDVGGDGETGMVVDELEDHAFAAYGQNVFGAVELPARLRRRIDEPPISGPRFLPRLQTDNPCVTENPRHRRRHWDHPLGPRLLVNTNRSVIEPRLLERRANADGLANA